MGRRLTHLLCSIAEQTIAYFMSSGQKKIGIDLYTGRKDTLSGINPGSKIVVYYHRIDLVICTTKIRCNVAFSNETGEEMNDQLIGRSAVFDKMKFAIRQKVFCLYSGSESIRS